MESCGGRAFENRFGKSGTSSEPGEEEFAEKEFAEEKFALAAQLFPDGPPWVRRDEVQRARAEPLMAGSTVSESACKAMRPETARKPSLKNTSGEAPDDKTLSRQSERRTRRMRVEGILARLVP